MAPTSTSASGSALERPLARRRPVLLGLLGFLALVWFLYPPNETKPQLSSGAVHPPICPDEIKNVAIIGAGSAGASAAYYLNDFTGCHHLNITVYERNHYVGGRSTTVNVHDDPRHPVELGASVFVPINHNLVHATKRFHLHVRGRAGTSKLDHGTEILGIWDGQEFVFTQSDASNQYWNLAKLLWKYGISPIRTQRLVKKTVGSFLKIYEAPYFPFKSITETAADLDLLSATTVKGQQFLEANGIGEKFGHDIVQAATRVNYAQNLDQLHGLETMVCMAAEGGMSIQGGNWQIFDSMIKDSGATLLLNTTVNGIVKKDSGRFAIQATTPSLDPAQGISSTESTYDTIILASPLQFAKINFSPPLSSPPSSIPYVSLHVTLFTSPYRLSSAAFNLDSDIDMPTTILTTTPPDPEAKNLPFIGISTLGTIPVPRCHLPPEDGEPGCAAHDSEYIYKIFSPAPLSRSYIESLLHITNNDDTVNVISWIYEKRWDSYPYLPPISHFADMRLKMMDSKEREGEEVEGIWYTSGIESFISTMETSSLMGMNVARLIVDGWMDLGGGDA
ncbi:MAG: hypothetical protein Q9168_001285 [Polycauliona sp. 1 TL-2023]